MHNRRDAPWVEIPPAWALDIIDLQLLTLLAIKKQRSKELSPEDQKKVDAISDVVADINRKIDAAQQS